MEYTFRNSPGEKETKLVLGVSAIEIFSDKTHRNILYGDITEVLLNRSGHLYFMCISRVGEKPVRVSNFSYLDGEQVDQSRAYMTFVRVLHVHLYGKSTYFRTGSRRGRLILCIAGFAALASVAFFSAYYFNQLRTVPLFIVALLIIPAILLLHRVRPNQWPRSYDPASLPLHFLPPAT